MNLDHNLKALLTVMGLVVASFFAFGVAFALNSEWTKFRSKRFAAGNAAAIRDEAHSLMRQANGGSETWRSDEVGGIIAKLGMGHVLVESNSVTVVLGSRDRTCGIHVGPAPPQEEHTHELAAETWWYSRTPR